MASPISRTLGSLISAMSRWSGDAVPGRSWSSMAHYYVANRDASLVWLRDTLSPEEKPPATTSTCAFCFQEGASTRGVMARHGYRSPGRGAGYAPVVGGCRGDVYPSLERSREGTDALLRHLEVEEAKLLSAIRALKTGASPTCRVELYLNAWESPLGKPGHVLKVFTPDAWEEHRGSRGKSEQLLGPSWDWPSLVRVDQERHETAVRGLRELRAAAQAHLAAHGYVVPEPAEMPLNPSPAHEAANAAMLHFLSEIGTVNSVLRAMREHNLAITAATYAGAYGGSSAAASATLSAWAARGWLRTIPGSRPVLYVTAENPPEPSE